MKKFLIITLICVLGIFNVANSQVKDNAVKVNLFGAIVSQYQLSYERAFGEKFTAQLSLGYIDRTWEITVTGWDGNYEIGPRGLIIIPEGRYYFSEGMKGAYVGAFFRYRGVNQMVIDNIVDLDIDGNDIDWSLQRKKTSIGGGLVFGYQILISEAMVIDIFIGPQYKSLSVGNWAFDNSSYDIDDVPFILSDKGEKDGVGVRFGVNFGVAF